MIKSDHNHGFTLIEILIVVALIGALFLGILATIDPLEQLKKGTDTAKRSLASQVYNGFLSYYASQGAFPWTSDQVAVAGTAAVVTNVNVGFLPTAIAVGEFKSDFINLAGGNLGKIFMTSTADAQGLRQNLASCFLPDSKAFRVDANSKYNNQGVLSSGCTVTTPCYWCIKN